jgi:hypothetical protein
MKIRSKMKSTSALLGLAGLTMAAMVFAADQGAGSELKGAESPSVEARVARARAATSDNIDAKPKKAFTGACNPCGGCNPCAAACNPCAGDACNPCAGACNPCGGCSPCAGNAEPAELSGEELKAAYNGLKAGMKVSYGTSGANGASEYQGWQIFNTQPYRSATHGGRLVNNYANAIASRYGQFEEAGIMPVGSILAKDSLKISASGKAAPGPLFLMEKMDAGYDPENGDWKYSMITPNGATWGVTGGKNSKGMRFCSDCHVAVEDFDYLFFLPDAYRKE